jgi:AP-2 complex subunit mu-1
MRGGQEFIFSADAELTSMTVRKSWSRPPISMDFQVYSSSMNTKQQSNYVMKVLMFTCSGLQVKFLKVYEKSNYKSVKWVRYMSKAGSYQIKVFIFCLGHNLLTVRR